jgi:hypothetical protein
MKKMKTTIATTVALAACVSTQLLAQNVKEDTITFALTVQQQSSVSTSASLANQGLWSQGPTHYKTSAFKMSQVDLLRDISVVMHPAVGNGAFYTPQAKLVLVQGELGGFWNITDPLAQSYQDYSQESPYDALGTTADPYWFDEGTFNNVGTDSGLSQLTDIQAVPQDLASVNYPSSIYGTGNDIGPIFPDQNDSTLVSAGTSSYARLATGRHFLPVPPGYATTGEYPVGHMQPWGQIFVKDPGHKDSAGNPLCENVTFFFQLEVEECYDCFYLSSYITDANFITKAGAQVGPPCCTSPSFLLGKGTDKYYLALSFDNTLNNGYLNPSLKTNTYNVEYYYDYTGHTGLTVAAGVADGLSPDLLPYVDSIQSGLGKPSPFECRFTLGGILTYSWNLQLVNKTDVAAEFVGTGTYQANGFGFIKLVCSLITGTATFSEKIVKDSGCCDDYPWYNDWYGLANSDNYGTGYFVPGDDQYNPYPYYNIIAGVRISPLYTPGLPYSADQNESPYNPGAGLSKHGLIYGYLNNY